MIYSRSRYAKQLNLADHCPLVDSGRRVCAKGAATFVACTRGNSFPRARNGSALFSGSDSARGRDCAFISRGVVLLESGSRSRGRAVQHEPIRSGADRQIVNIHNPSIEVHTVDRSLNTGAAVILVAGGGHNTLNVAARALTRES